MNSKTLGAGAMSLLLAATAPALAQNADPDSIWTIRTENDAISTIPGGSDHNYTAGNQIGWTSGTDAVPDFASSLSQTLWGDGTVRVGLGFSQQLYTPTNKTLSVPDPRDRPYAGYADLTGSLMHDTDNTRDYLALSLGVIGPLAQGSEAQNQVHRYLGDSLAMGWSHQLPNEAAVELIDQRTWRVPLASLGGLETDLLPALAVGVGTVRDYGQAAVLVRIGHGLDHDFGPSRIRPGVSGGDAFKDSNEVSWYVFAGVNGQAVARDAFLDGDLFTASAHVHRIPWVGEMEGGLGLIWRWGTPDRFHHRSTSFKQHQLIDLPSSKVICFLYGSQ